MKTQDVIQKTAEFARKSLQHQGAGHDWWHAMRVWMTAKKIAENEGADLLVVQLAALLHDIEDYKFGGSGEPLLARKWLDEIGVDKKVVEHVCSIISKMSFKGAGVKSDMPTLEGKVVQDADRLDALGAIGIARAFSYGGSKGRVEHDPNQKPHLHKTFEEYKARQSTTINHFYEKLLLLKDLMNTKTAKKLAEQRHEYMKQFINEFMTEWEAAE